MAVIKFSKTNIKTNDYRMEPKKSVTDMMMEKIFKILYNTQEKVEENINLNL